MQAHGWPSSLRMMWRSFTRSVPHWSVSHYEEPFRNIPQSALMNFEHRLLNSLHTAPSDRTQIPQVGMDLELHNLIVSHCGNKTTRELYREYRLMG